jgi:hypothetical protein
MVNKNKLIAIIEHMGLLEVILQALNKNKRNSLSNKNHIKKDYQLKILL